MDYDICVLGLGYIGLPTASVFATKGKRVLGVDVVPSVVDTINRGQIHIHEPELDLLVRAAVGSGNLSAATSPSPARVFIIAVPTPFMVIEGNPKAPDLTFVEAAARSIAAVVRPGNLIILESTSPVGTTELVREWIVNEAAIRGNEAGALESTLRFVHCPERILPGQMLRELVTNDRICGGLTVEAAEQARELYRVFCTGEIHLTDARTAELCKLTENASRDVGIAFANELSLICAELKIDVWELIRLANHHPRVKILQPGPGVGGHCIAVDPWFIVAAAPQSAKLIRTAREVNDSKPQMIVRQVAAAAAKYAQPTVACLGITFKANVDDIRESPSLDIVLHLSELKVGRILVAEPYVRSLPGTLAALADGPKLVSATQAIAEADVVVLLVDHREFAEIDRSLLKNKSVIDTRGLWR